MKRASQRHLPVYVNQVHITALLDLVLVLLLVFIVAVPFLRREKAPQPSLPLTVPEATDKPDPAPKDRFVLIIQPDQKIVFEGKPVTGEQLLPEIQKLLAKKPDSGVLVKMPSNFAAGSLARLMEEMHRVGVKHTAVEVVETAKP